MTAVWHMRGLSPAERLVLLKHADHADDDGCNSYPSIKLLKDTCELTERHVQRTSEVATAGRPSIELSSPTSKR
jgi:hypothetical protein